ncbi:hypothetical protein KUTeg_022253 [Tegillarca granosa]|uniref:Uncharacterized protein n=1 Tax=Tegillarca granosa TaxID=220873 RepID=A0ABQ9E8L6_TEGGR|nr:hypothetical protein KUTeg_022253 [Tegillarca granosa]
MSSTNSVWHLHQQLYIDSIQQKGRSLKLGGDARCCSRHTVKYGSYSLIDLERSKIVDIQLVQVN